MSYTRTIIGGSIIGFALIAAAPTLALAHGGADDANDTSGTGTAQPMMMHSEEVDDETHEQMEQLMHEMWEGELSADEAQQMSNMMSEYDGSVMPMMGGGMMGSGMMNDTWSAGHMAGPFTAGAGWLGLFTGALQVIWLIVGLLAIAWLIKKLRQ